VAWTRKHIAKYGGDPERLYLLGHSAGGHLVSLLATDDSYLRAEGLKRSDIKGVISASGVYRVPPGPMRLTLGGAGPKGVGVDQQWPPRGDPLVSLDFLLPRLTVTVDIAEAAFGPDPKERAKASPLTHIQAGLPPFLLLTAAHDLPTLAESAEEFHRALLREGCSCRLLKLDKRNHNSLLFSAIRPDDPAARAILEFIKKN
jgi:acetyl esterase/lipase